MEGPGTSGGEKTEMAEGADCGGLQGATAGGCVEGPLGTQAPPAVCLFWQRLRRQWVGGRELPGAEGLQGWAWRLWVVLRVFKEKPCRGGVAPVDAFLGFHKATRWTGLGHGR